MKRAKLMMETLDDLLTNLNWRDGRAKMAVWAYNSHLGDPRDPGTRQQREPRVWLTKI
jgi:erythromycin esterase-like protein